MFNKTFEYKINPLPSELLVIILKTIKKDLKSEGVFDCYLDSNSISFKGKGSINRISPFLSIDFCEIKIDPIGGRLEYKISYNNVIVFSSILVFSFVVINFILQISLFFWGVIPIVLLFPIITSSNIRHMHESYAESLVSLIEDEIENHMENPIAQG